MKKSQVSKCIVTYVQICFDAQIKILWDRISFQEKQSFLIPKFIENIKVSTTCSLKWVNELQHEILSQLIIYTTLGITFHQLAPYRLSLETSFNES